ncbi:transposable element Tcb2 transposase [Trichonephila clavipes]|nr:transposable element Tcb2 transposase [Trichonephila clavipes]
MSFTRRLGSGRLRHTSRQVFRHIVKNAHAQPIASSAAIQLHVIPLLGAPVSFRTIRSRRVERHLGSQRLLRVLHLTPPIRRLRLERCRARVNLTAVEWNQVILSDEFKFNLSIDDIRVLVWRPRGERLNPGFALQGHIAPTAGVMVFDVIAYYTQSHLVFIRGTVRAQRYVYKRQKGTKFRNFPSKTFFIFV